MPFYQLFHFFQSTGSIKEPLTNSPRQQKGLLPMLIFDAHLDLAWNAIDWNRDLRLPVAEIRRSEADMHGKGRGCNTVAFPDLRRGKVAIFIATLLARLLRPGLVPAIQRYSSMEAAYASAQGQLAYYQALEAEGLLRFVKDARTLKNHVRAWLEADDTAAEPLGFILSMEGADPVLSPKQVSQWWEQGLRIIGPAHYGVSPYAHGTGTEGGLFPDGPDLLRAMEEVGMILDVTHLSDQCFEEALEIYHGPVLASHHNCRGLVPNQRQLTDDQIKRLIDRGAVIGAAFDSWMLYPGWIRGETSPEVVRLDAVLDHIDRVCQFAGNARHAALGTDLDGGFGREQSPCDLDTIADLQRLPEMLRGRGYSQEDIEGVMYGNWVRFFTDAWK
jgi:membrane dipeptidase